MVLKTRPRSFYDIYVWNISPKLREIDILLKTSHGGIKPTAAAEILDITDDEICRIMDEEHISTLNRVNFFSVMRRGSSDICQYADREVKCGSPLTYTKDEIAYIYGLDADDVARACEITGIKEATAITLPCLFYHIPAR